MKEEELIKKWLDNNLDAHEMGLFKELEEYEELVKLSNRLKFFKAPDYDTSVGLNNVLNKINKAKQQQSRKWLKTFVRIAAVFVILFGAYYYTTTLNTSVQTFNSQKSSLVLPDDSQVDINASSRLTYNEKNWNNNREVNLEGEAFFKVAKGSKFTVRTKTGSVSVLGTQFNVKQRDNYFEVICFEGLVRVEFNTQKQKLSAGERFLVLNGNTIKQQKEIDKNPSWINNESNFRSLPFKYVIAEFERQYKVKITTNNVNLDRLFTGAFTHNNMDIALKSITKPFGLKYEQTKNNIVLKGE